MVAPRVALRHSLRRRGERAKAQILTAAAAKQPTETERSRRPSHCSTSSGRTRTAPTGLARRTGALAPRTLTPWRAGARDHQYLFGSSEVGGGSGDAAGPGRLGALDGHASDLA